MVILCACDVTCNVFPRCLTKMLCLIYKMIDNCHYLVIETFLCRFCFLCHTCDEAFTSLAIAVYVYLYVLHEQELKLNESANRNAWLSLWD